MDKTAIRNFAMEARNILRAMAEKEAGFYGVTKDGCAAPIQKGVDFETYRTLAGTENTIYGADIRRRRSLKKAVHELGFDQVIEETAYTWFNRMIAIRFMEVNDYLPTRVRVLSSENGGLTPDIVSHSLDVDLNLTSEELDRVQKAKEANKFDEAYRILFIRQCNELNDILPGLFERTDDYMELLLKVSYTGDSVIRLLVDTVAEDNFNVEAEGQVEIIGWMYQYYNSELKDDTFAKLRKNIKITKERIPAATQLFTPDWIVRYMVENSVGRVWMDHLRAVDARVDEKTRAEEYGWKYYLPEAEQEAEVAGQLTEVRKSYKDIAPQDITCIDPCMGSGHILVYMVDVLMDIYKSEGYSERDAVFDILEKNIFGLDIDRRAYQLSYFALMMKGREYGGRRFFKGRENEDGERIPAMPHVYAIEESNAISRGQLKYFGAGLDELSKKTAAVQMNGLLDTMKDAKEYGSILNVENYDWKLLQAYVSETDTEGQMTFDSAKAESEKKLLVRLVEIGEVLAGKYDAVVTNPPYMSSTGMNHRLLDNIKSEYTDSKSDLFAVFIEKCQKFTVDFGYYAMITQHAWMFLTSFERLRSKIVNNNIINLVHLGARAFNEIGGEVVQTTSFVKKRDCITGYKGVYIRLVDFNGENEKKGAFLSIKRDRRENYYETDSDRLSAIPGMPVAYWVTGNIITAFRNQSLDEIGFSYQGIITGNVNRFLKTWYEIEFLKITFNENSISALEHRKTYYPYVKGGGYRKWYGNHEYVILWRNNGKELTRSRTENRNLFFKEGITWSLITTASLSFRLLNGGFLCDVAGSSYFPQNMQDLYLILGFLNSIVSEKILGIINPTLNLNIKDILLMPIVREKEHEITKVVKTNIHLTAIDWDSFETSWDFQCHPLLSVIPKNYIVFDDMDHINLAQCFACWEKECSARFDQLKANEEELNRIFIDIYGLQEELTPEVEDKDITVRKADLGRDIRSLISYAVGCMFGRYSVAEKGLIYAGGKFDRSRYGDFPADDDGIIPITDEAYFDDDIIGRFEKFIQTVFGTKSLEDNLDYIAAALGTKGVTSREKIRTYFLKDFFKDHCNTYSVTGSGKRPIYWLFDSGRQNGFKALIYMHRYTPDTVGLVRSVYLKKVSEAIEASLKNAEYIISENISAVDVAQATKKRDKYVKQLAEIKPYYQALSHVAMQRIPLDLDDGVKVNYAKFQGIEVAEDGGKRQTIDLLAKI